MCMHLWVGFAENRVFQIEKKVIPWPPHWDLKLDSAELQAQYFWNFSGLSLKSKILFLFVIIIFMDVISTFLKRALGHLGPNWTFQDLLYFVCWIHTQNCTHQSLRTAHVAHHQLSQLNGKHAKNSKQS